MYALALPQSNRPGCPNLDTEDTITSQSASELLSAIGFSHYALNFNEFLQVYVTKIEGFKNEAGFMDKAGVSSDAFNLLHSVFNMSTH